MQPIESDCPWPEFGFHFKDLSCSRMGLLWLGNSRILVSKPYCFLLPVIPSYGFQRGVLLHSWSPGSIENLGERWPSNFDFWCGMHTSKPGNGKTSEGFSVWVHSRVISLACFSLVIYMYVFCLYTYVLNWCCVGLFGYVYIYMFNVLCLVYMWVTSSLPQSFSSQWMLTC